MGRLFGTDGVRGIANTELTPSFAFKLGKAGAYVLSRDTAKPVILIGTDTRISGDMYMPFTEPQKKSTESISKCVLSISRTSS